jgi:hypothetical protein
MEDKLNLEPLYKETDVARILNRSVKTLRKDRLFGRGPRYIHVGGSVRYRPQDVADVLRGCPSGGPPVAA